MEDGDKDKRRRWSEIRQREETENDRIWKLDAIEKGSELRKECSYSWGYEDVQKEKDEERKEERKKKRRGRIRGG